jgi:hypothetical protein
MNLVLGQHAEVEQRPGEWRAGCSGGTRFVRRPASRIDSAAGDVTEDVFAAGLMESVFLQIRILRSRSTALPPLRLIFFYACLPPLGFRPSVIVLPFIAKAVFEIVFERDFGDPFRQRSGMDLLHLLGQHRRQVSTRRSYRDRSLKRSWAAIRAAKAK